MEPLERHGSHEKGSVVRDEDVLRGKHHQRFLVKIRNEGNWPIEPKTCVGVENVSGDSQHITCTRPSLLCGIDKKAIIAP
jgi:hypothetical protein